MIPLRYISYFLGFEQQALDEDNQRRRYHATMLKTIRNTFDPFMLTERTFVRYFRLSRHATKTLIDKLAPYGDTKSIPFGLCFLGALFFLAHGSYQKNVGISGFYSVSQPSVSRHLHHIVELIQTHVMPEEIRFPSTDEDFAEKVRGFQEKYEGLMPEVFGLVDGTLIPIASPKRLDPEFPAQVYRTRKGFLGLNVLVITCADGSFCYVNARFPGSVHDSAIFRSSQVWRQLSQEYRTTGRNRGILLGDRGFMNVPWLYTLIIPGPDGLSPMEQRFNNAHKQVRCQVETDIGDMKSIFRCTNQHRVLHYDLHYDYELCITTEKSTTFFPKMSIPKKQIQFL